MNRRRLPVVLVAACGLLLLAPSCENENVDHRHPKVSHDLLLTPEHPLRLVSIDLGTQLRLILPMPPSGYVWDIVSNNIRVLEQTSLLRQAPRNAQAPAIAFYALKPGRSVIRFVLLRPADRDAIPTEHFEVTVRVNDEE